MSEHGTPGLHRAAAARSEPSPPGDWWTRIIVDTIEREVVLGLRIAVRTEAIRSRVRNRRVLENARREQRQVRITPRIQRQIVILGRADRSPYVG